MRFGFSAGANVTGWPWAPAMQDRWAALLRDQAAEIAACTGFMTDTGEAGEGLSEAIRRLGRWSAAENPDNSITRSRQVLQDYCWITILPAELATRLGGAIVRVQWDPERSLLLESLPWRSIQIGLSGEAAARYVREWITSITDIASTAHQIRDLVGAGNHQTAQALLPAERPYPLPASLKTAIGTGWSLPGRR